MDEEKRIAVLKAIISLMEACGITFGDLDNFWKKQLDRESQGFN